MAAQFSPRPADSASPPVLASRMWLRPFRSSPAHDRHGCSACCEDAASPFRMLLRPILGLRPKLGPSPNYSIDIRKQGFIIKRTSLPNTRAGPPIINGPLHHPGSNGIIVNVIHLLHEESFTENWINILLRLPKRISVVSIANFVLKFCEGSVVISFF